MKKQPAVTAETKRPAEGLWLHPDGTSIPYFHRIDGECACETCASKIRYIILPVAA